MNSVPRPADRLIVALDFPTSAAALNLVDQLEGTCRWFKVGMELYYASGNQVIEQLQARGHNIFLDLKLHDIPNTVAAGVKSLGTLGASLLTIHAAGGEAMMRAAADAAATLSTAPTLLAVTVLTSMDARQLRGTGVPDSPAAQVHRLAILAKASGINGIVCSPQEVHEVRQIMGSDATLVTPGIRPEGGERGDQRRVATPAAALASGASMLVVGRPITQAKDPADAAREILKEMAAADTGS